MNFGSMEYSGNLLCATVLSPTFGELIYRLEQNTFKAISTRVIFGIRLLDAIEPMNKDIGTELAGIESVDTTSFHNNIDLKCRKSERFTISFPLIRNGTPTRIYKRDVLFINPKGRKRLVEEVLFSL